MAYKLGNDIIDKIYVGASQVDLIYIGSDVVSIIATIQTTSLSATYSPSTIVKTGALLNWRATGIGITTQEFNANDPTFDFSSNTANDDILITISSTDNLTGFTTFDITDAEMFNVDFENVIDLETYDISAAGSLTSVDVSNNVNLLEIRFSSNGITSLDISNNPLLNILYLNSSAYIGLLDISNNNNLQRVYGYGTYIDSIKLPNDISNISHFWFATANLPSDEIDKIIIAFDEVGNNNPDVFFYSQKTAELGTSKSATAWRNLLNNGSDLYRSIHGSDLYAQDNAASRLREADSITDWDKDFGAILTSETGSGASEGTYYLNTMGNGDAYVFSIYNFPTVSGSLYSIELDTRGVNISQQIISVVDNGTTIISDDTITTNWVTKTYDFIAAGTGSYLKVSPYRDVGDVTAEIHADKMTILENPVTNFLTNGIFYNDTFWVKWQDTLIEDNVAKLRANQTFYYVLQSPDIVGMVHGKTYKITFDMLNYVQGEVGVFIGLVAHGEERFSSNGTHTLYLTYNDANSPRLIFDAKGGDLLIADVTNITVEEAVFTSLLTMDGTFEITVSGTGSVLWGDNTVDTYAGTDIDLSHSYSNFDGNIQFKGSLYKIDTTDGNLRHDIADLPKTLTYYYNVGTNTSYGDIANLPSGMTYYAHFGNNTITGDISNIPSGSTVFRAGGSEDLQGDIGTLPNTLTYFQATGGNNISGSISNLPSGLERFIIFGANTTSGDIEDLPSVMFEYSNLGANTVSGSIDNIPSGLITFRNNGNTTVDSYISPHEWDSGMVYFSHLPAAGYGLTTAEVDNVLIDLDNSGMTCCYLVVNGENSARSSASDQAMINLINNGVSVYVNEYAKDTDYQAVLDFATAETITEPDFAQQIIQNNLVLDYKSNGIWDEEDRIYVFANNGSKEFGLIDWKDTSRSASLSTVEPVWISNQGFQGNSTGSSADGAVVRTNFTPISDAVKYQWDNFNVVTYVYQATTEADSGYAALFNYVDSTNESVIYKAIGGGYNAKVHNRSSGNRSLPASNELGVYSLMYSSSLAIPSKVYSSGSLLDEWDLAISVPDLSNRQFYILGANNSGATNYVGNAIQSFWSAGSSQESKQSIKATLIENYIADINS